MRGLALVTIGLLFNFNYTKMKTLLFLLLIVSGACFGQSGSLQITQVRNDMTARPTKTESLIAIQFIVNHPEKDSISYRQIYNILVANDTKEYYDWYAKQYSGFHNAKGRRVDIRFVVNDKIKDFTFAEFRKILFD